MCKKNKQVILCETKFCRKKRANKSKLCHSCIKERYKLAHPVKYAYQILRQNAKRRKKSFDLTFEQFESFCYKTNLLQGRGKTADSWHIDRIDNEKGYSIENIQILTNTDNVLKEQYRRKMCVYDLYTQKGYYQELRPTIQDFSIPF